MDFLRQLYEQFASIWKSLSPQQRIFVGLGFAIALISLFSLTLWQTTPQYNILYANLQQRDAGEIVEKLKTIGVSYKLSDDGGTILVPSRDIAETRLALAQEGLPRGGGVGYEIFDRTRLGATNFEQKVNLKRATEGELARTINQLSEVQWSRVQIVMAEERLFTEQQEEAKASVFLNVVPGQSLQRKQIQAIQHLVAHSVEGLRPENITILDQYANPLALPAGPYMDTAELSSSQFELRSQVERHFQRKIQHMFDRVLGPAKSVVSISVDLDFDSIERTEEKYDPDSAVVRSEERQRESTVSPAGQIEGVAGVSANLPTVAPLTSITGVSGPKREASSTVTNYEISKTIEHIIKSPSTIKSLSASVVVDGSYKEITAPDGTVTKEYIPRSEEEIDKYRRMVLATLGNPTTRTAEVINVPLEVPPSELEYGAVARDREMRDLYLMLAKGIVTIILLAVIFLVVRYMLRRALPAAGLFPREGVGARVDMVTHEDVDPLKELREMLDERPEVLASLIKAWVKEED